MTTISEKERAQLNKEEAEWHKGRVICPVCKQKHLEPSQYREILDSGVRYEDLVTKLVS